MRNPLLPFCGDGHRPSYLLFHSFAGDPVCDLIPIYLDVFRGDQSLLQQFLKSYKLPFRGMSQHESVGGDDKYGRLSYVIMWVNGLSLSELNHIFRGGTHLDASTHIGAIAFCMRRMFWELSLVYGMNSEPPSPGKKLSWLCGERWMLTKALPDHRQRLSYSLIVVLSSTRRKFGARSADYFMFYNLTPLFHILCI